MSSREQAIGWAERYGKILGDGEIELGTPLGATIDAVGSGVEAAWRSGRVR